MSFGKTRTPRKSEVLEGKTAKWQIRKEERRGTMVYVMDDEMKERFIRYFPKHTNREVMKAFGISFSSLQRFKREFGLEHDMRAVRKKRAAITKRVCEQNGYYDSLRGKRPSEQCIEAIRRKRQGGWHPLDETRKNMRRYRRLMDQRAANRHLLIEKERKRDEYGLPRKTNLWLPFVKYSRPQLHIRLAMRKRGYVLGNKWDEDERLMIWWTDTTDRSARMEKNAAGLKFEIAGLTERSAR